MANKAKTTEQFKKEIYERVQDEYTVLGDYKTNKTKIKMRHNICNYEWDVEPSSFLKGTRCPNCSHAKQRKTQEQFEKEIYDLVGDEYTVIGKYKNTSTKIKMIHNVCGREFEIIPNGFLQGNRCNYCGIKITGMKNKKSHEVFKDEVFSLVGDEYSLLSEYENCYNKVLFKHNTCGNEFLMKPNSFLSGYRCPKCGIESRAFKRTKTNEEFLVKVTEKFGNEYSMVSKYTKSTEKITFKHNNCGCEFDMNPYNFLNSSEPCPQCSNRIKITTDYFKQEVFNLVGDEYSVLGEYHSAHAKIQLRHNKCGNVYDGCRNMFLKGHRCPQCYSSKGEDKITKYLRDKSISFKSQKTFKGLVGLGGGNLKYDFYIPDYKLLIEYNGEQHYKPVEAFGGENQLEIQKEHDQRKRDYAKEHNYKLLEIGYWDFNNIEDILDDFIKEAA